MVELLAAAKLEGLDFDQAWDRAWQIMVRERAFPHRTAARKQWHKALKDCRPELEASYYQVETGYSRWHERLVAITDASRFAGDEVVVAELVA